MQQRRATGVFTITTVIDGSDGYSSAIVRLYRRSASVLTDNDRPSGTLYYRFADGKLYTDAACTTEATGSSAAMNGWSMAKPQEDADTKLYVTMATATSRDEVDAIVVDSTASPAVNEWSTPVEYTENLHTATVMLYKRSATALSAHGITSAVYYRFSDGKLFTTKVATTETAIEANKLSGWTRTVPETDGNPLYQIQATAVSIDALDNIGSSEWSEPVKYVKDGENGDNAYNTAIVRLFKRQMGGLPTPDRPSISLWYKFSTQKLYTDADCTTEFTTSTAGGNEWGMTIPEAQPYKKIYVTCATAYAQGDVDKIEVDMQATPQKNEWSTPVVYNENGMNVASVAIYKRAADRPADTPTKDAPDDGSVYNFETGVLTAPTGGSLNLWSTGYPDSNAQRHPCWVRHATAASNGQTDVINKSEWSEATKVVEDGKDGKDSAQVVLTPGSIVIMFDDSGTFPLSSTDEEFTIAAAINLNGTTLTSTNLELVSKPSDLSFQKLSNTSFKITSRYTDTPDYNNGGSVVIRMTGMDANGNSYTATGALPVIASWQGGQGEPGQPGQPGQNTVEYRLQVSTNLVEFERDYAGVTSAKPANINISVKKIEGSTETVLNALPSGYGIYYHNGTSWGSTSIGLGSRNTKNDFTVNNVVVDEIRYGFGTSASNILQQVSVVSQWNYQRMLVPAGEYTNKEYTRTVNTTPLVYHNDGSAGRYYFLIQDTNRINGSNIEPGQDNSVWQLASEYEVILTKMLFARFAQLGGFIVYGDYFFSQYGTLIDSNGTKITVDATNYATNYTSGGKTAVPYGWFDSAHPMDMSTPSSGYRFYPTKCIDALTGEEWMAGGNVHVNQNGDVAMRNIRAVDGVYEGEVKVNSTKGKWDIKPNYYGIGRPSIVGTCKDTNNVEYEYMEIAFDSDPSDATRSRDGGGMYFYNMLPNLPWTASRYCQEAWHVNCRDYGDNGFATYIEAIPSASQPEITFFSNYNQVSGEPGYKSTQVIKIGINHQGAYLDSDDWMKESEATNGMTYVDDWGDMRVKGISSYPRINVRTSSFTLPAGAPIGTIFLCKGITSDLIVTAPQGEEIQNSPNNDPGPVNFERNSGMVVKMTSTIWAAFWCG